MHSLIKLYILTKFMNLCSVSIPNKDELILICISYDLRLLRSQSFIVYVIF